MTQAGRGSCCEMTGVIWRRNECVVTDYSVLQFSSSCARSVWMCGLIHTCGAPNEASVCANSAHSKIECGFQAGYGRNLFQDLSSHNWSVHLALSGLRASACQAFPQQGGQADQTDVGLAAGCAPAAEPRAPPRTNGLYMTQHQTRLAFSSLRLAAKVAPPNQIKK